MTILRQLSNQLTEAAMKRQGQILPTENTAWGYHGVIENAFGGIQAHEIWNVTFTVLMSDQPEVASESIREFLDGKGGRHLGDAVIDAAISALPPGTYDPDSNAQLPGLPLPRMKQAIKGVISKQAWVRKQIAQVGSATGGVSTGTAWKVEDALKRAQSAWVEAQAQEKKKNWKQRDAAMHDVQKAADALTTAARAWLAQRR